jgi:hypothetical protein
MEFLWYASQINTEKLKVNRFLFGFNFNNRAKVRIPMSRTLHDVVQKALIEEEDLISRGESRTPTRTTRKVSSGVQQHETPARHTLGYSGF